MSCQNFCFPILRLSLTIVATSVAEFANITGNGGDCSSGPLLDSNTDPSVFLQTGVSVPVEKWAKGEPQLSPTAAPMAKASRADSVAPTSWVQVNSLFHEAQGFHAFDPTQSIHSESYPQQLPSPYLERMEWSFGIVLIIALIMTVRAVVKIWNAQGKSSTTSEDTTESQSPQIARLMLLQFLWGVSWAVQRPQGFNILLFANSGIEPEVLGYISMCSIVASCVGAPICGMIVDLMPTKKLTVYNLGVQLRTLFHISLYPVMTFASPGIQPMCCLALMSMAMFFETSGVLFAYTVQEVGTLEFGKVRLCAGIGFGVGSLFTGAVSSLLPSLGTRVVFLESIAVAVLTSLTIWFINAQGHKEEADKPVAATRVLPKMLQMMSSPRHSLFFIIVLAMGLCEGVMMSYTYLRLKLLPNGTETVMGLSTVCMIISEIPFFYFSGYLLEMFGLMPILTYALIFSFLRQTWTALLQDAWMALLGELLHGITFSVANTAIVDHCQKISPKGLENSVQSLQVAVYVGLGQGGGAWFGGHIIKTLGVVWCFTWSALLALASAVLPTVLFWCPHEPASLK